MRSSTHRSPWTSERQDPLWSCVRGVRDYARGVWSVNEIGGRTSRGGEATHRIEEHGGRERLLEHRRARVLQEFPRRRVRRVAREEHETLGERRVECDRAAIQLVAV